MQSGGWINLLRRFPPEIQHNLLLTTSNGNDIVIQSVIQMDKEYLVIRGRVTGTMDGGGFLFIPYDQIIFLGFQQPMKEADIRAMLGGSDAPGVARETPAPSAVNPETPPRTIPAPPPDSDRSLSDSKPPSSGTLGAEPAKSAGTNKAALLERLRARRQDLTTP